MSKSVGVKKKSKWITTVHGLKVNTVKTQLLIDL